MSTLLTLSVLVCAPAYAQKEGIDKEDYDPVGQREMERDPLHAHWRFFQELTLPDREAAPRYYAIELPPHVIGQSQGNLQDLRLADQNGERVPYALRVLQPQKSLTLVPIVRRFDAGYDDKNNYYQEAFELSGDSISHNEITVQVTGMNFRRRVQIFGADDAQFTNALAFLPRSSYAVRYDVEGKLVELNRFHYDLKKFRFLRVRVYDDPTISDDQPKITEVVVRQLVTEPGEFSVVGISDKTGRQAVWGDGGPASAWFIDLGHSVYCSKLTFRSSGVADRTFRLQIAEPNQPRQDVHGVDWDWEQGPNQEKLVHLRFQEQKAQRYRLLVTDFANAPLDLFPVSYSAAKRQILFELPKDKKVAMPLKLFYNNPSASPANYDLAKTLPRKLDPAPAAASLQGERENPNYEKPPQSFPERNPWAIYAVLTIACLVLAGLLALLARQAVARVPVPSNP